jgi:5-methylcytosine-specific restriction endonuclease McrA
MEKLTPIEFDEPDTQLALLRNFDNEFDWAPVGAALNRRFNYFRSCAPAIAAMSATPAVLAPHKETLEGIYSSAAKEAVDLRSSVLEIHKVKCPYCGEPTQPVTIDHFVPKSLLPEFAFFSENLIPSCWFCNHRKWTYLWDGDGRRLFLSPFIDSFLSLPFFSIKVEQREGAPDFEDPEMRIRFDRHISRAQHRIAREHFKRLEVSRRLFQHIRTEVKVLRYALLDQILGRTSSSIKLADDIRSKLHGETKVRGTNSWNAICFRTILGNHDYLQFIATIPIEPE